MRGFVIVGEGGRACVRRKGRGGVGLSIVRGLGGFVRTAAEGRMWAMAVAPATAVGRAGSCGRKRGLTCGPNMAAMGGGARGGSSVDERWASQDGLRPERKRGAGRRRLGRLGQLGCGERWKKGKEGRGYVGCFKSQGRGGGFTDFCLGDLI